MSKTTSKNRVSSQSSLYSEIKINSIRQENFVSSFYLVLKISFSLLAIVSLIKLGHSSKVRLTRLREIKESYLYEKSRFNALSNRFDDLFSFEGQQRFMKDQDQMIFRDIIRVIWR